MCVTEYIGQPMSLCVRNMATEPRFIFVILGKNFFSPSSRHFANILYSCIATSNKAVSYKAG